MNNLEINPNKVNANVDADDADHDELEMVDSAALDDEKFGGDLDPALAAQLKELEKMSSLSPLDEGEDSIDLDQIDNILELSEKDFPKL